MLSINQAYAEWRCQSKSGFSFVPAYNPLSSSSPVSNCFLASASLPRLHRLRQRNYRTPQCPQTSCTQDEAGLGLGWEGAKLSLERLIAGKGLMEDERSRMSQGKKRRRQGQRAKKKRIESLLVLKIENGQSVFITTHALSQKLVQIRVLFRRKPSGRSCLTQGTAFSWKFEASVKKNYLHKKWWR